MASRLTALWAWRRWVYAAYMLVAVARIPARTGFQLTSPSCDTRITLENIGLSLTKLPHIVLFGVFFLVTVVQFNHIDRRALAYGLLATAALGLLVELEEGATRTGNCRLTDVLPDLVGALGALVLILIVRIVHDRVARRRTAVGASSHD